MKERPIRPARQLINLEPWQSPEKSPYMQSVYTCYSDKCCLKSTDNHRNKGQTPCLLSQLADNGQETLFYPAKPNVILISFPYSWKSFRRGDSHCPRLSHTLASGQPFNVKMEMWKQTCFPLLSKWSC